MLLMPELFPTSQQPTAGIFILDQLKALSTFADVDIYHTHLWKPGDYLQLEDLGQEQFHLLSKKPSLPWHKLAYPLWEQEAFRYARSWQPPDVLHLHGASLRGPLAMRLARLWECPLVITEHTGPWSSISERPLLLRRARRAIESADLLLPVSTHLSQEIADSGIRPRRIEVLGNPLDTDFFSLRSKPLGAAKRILFLGRWDAFKGALRSLQAFIHIAGRIPDFRISIAGMGEESEALHKLARESKLGDRIEIIEAAMSREAMRGHFHRSSFLVFPSLHESFGLVAAEAMSTGLPVVITNRTGPRDYFQPSVGVQVEPDSIDGLSASMLHMAQHLSVFEPQEVRRGVVERYSLEQYAGHLRRLYTEVIDSMART